MKRRTSVADDWRAPLARAGLTDIADLLDHSPTELRLAGTWETLTKPGLGGRERWRWQLDDQAGTVLYLKRYRHTPLLDQIDRISRQACCHSRAWGEFRESDRLGGQYISAVRAVAVAEEMTGLIEKRGVVLFERVPGDGFDRVWVELCRRKSPLTRGWARHDIARRLARFAAAFHQTGACHRDLYLCHVFADIDDEGRRPPLFTLIDLARLHRPRMRRMRWIIKDLSQLDTSARQIGASRSDRLRFLLAYLGLQPGAPRTRWYARRIVRKSTAILRRIERKSRSS